MTVHIHIGNTAGPDAPTDTAEVRNAVTGTVTGPVVQCGDITGGLVIGTSNDHDAGYDRR